MGAELYDLPAALPEEIPVITFDDATMVQQIRDPYSDASLANIPPKLFARSAASQRAASEVATVCCVATRWAAISFEEEYGIPSEKIVVTGMGHRPRSAVAGEDRDWSRPRFLFVGSEWKGKNGAAVLKAFEMLREQRPEASLDLVGDHPQINMLGVTTHGFLAREDASAQLLLDHLYAKATGFVLPSLFEAAGIAYLEAASSGLPVVATIRGGAPEVLNDGAIVVDPYDPAALLEAMLTLCDSDTARSMGAKAFQAAAASSWRKVASRVLDALVCRTPTRDDRSGSFGQ
ncbi:glycosyltransferase family 4 protein [Streptomyces sp. NPDC102274]|uniref:glycosyltransferase family 4 protein n=1 Tax=Streptomyces sp. NPDC102274 TaxID=3366151 RepID=UPI0037F7105A